MAETTVNKKFIANPSFMIQSVGKQTITVGWRPRYVVISEHKDGSGGDPDIPEEGQYLGFCDWPIGFGGVLSQYSPKSVSLQPEISLKVSQRVDAGEPVVGPSELIYTVPGMFFFDSFLSKNPIHLTKLNVRSNNASYLPSTLEILTPNIFTGQFDRQIVNIIADTNMYQNQSNIVTLDCDVFITRSSILRVDSEFVVNHIEGVAGEVPILSMDMTFDKYLSLEKALVENYQLLQTDAGMENAVAQEIADINARIPVMQNVQAQNVQAQGVPQFTQPLQMQMIPLVKPLIGASAGISVQPTVGKGNTNYL